MVTLEIVAELYGAPLAEVYKERVLTRTMMRVSVALRRAGE